MHLPDQSPRVLDRVRSMEGEFVSLLTDLCLVESPTEDRKAQGRVHEILAPRLRELGYETTIIAGESSGDHLHARPGSSSVGDPFQLLIGHTDTVWPIGTVDRMPVRVVDDRVEGPGTLDMKGGVTMMVIALTALRELGLAPALAPVLFINSDEEVGSPDSRDHVRRFATEATRALVLEPALGHEGRIKTARKGVGNFEIHIRGKAAHAGLDPDSGASAILELSRVIEDLHAMNDPAAGTTVNVGTVAGGTRANVIAAEARASVDVRIMTAEEGERVEGRIRAIAGSVPEVTIEIEGGIRVPPLERTPRNRRLWERARAAGAELGMDLEEGLAGGGSDGNTTSLHTATLDGLGCVGDGAHADHEHIRIAPTLDRCALLARLLLEPRDEGQR